MGFHQENA